ncbi:hypothetical protein [Streptomyces exfoliatus]|uniref:hypothetical protein n=1 Tax=Streptomyces exfoliatus TaxID=1905 RepID=UPI00068E6803|nr:hypothetical protein [Streptomyces exfoliatus]
MKQQQAAGLRGAGVQLPYFGERPQHRGAAQPAAGREQPGPAPLGDHRQAERPGHGGGLVGAGGDPGTGVGEAQGRTGPGERGPVGDPQQLLLGLLGQQEARGECGPPTGQGEGTDVVERNGQ